MAETPWSYHESKEAAIVKGFQAEKKIWLSEIKAPLVSKRKGTFPLLCPRKAKGLEGL